MGAILGNACGFQDSDPQGEQAQDLGGQGVLGLEQTGAKMELIRTKPLLCCAGESAGSRQEGQSKF